MNVGTFRCLMYVCLPLGVLGIQGHLLDWAPIDWSRAQHQAILVSMPFVILICEWVIYKNKHSKVRPRKEE